MAFRALTVAIFNSKLLVYQRASPGELLGKLMKSDQLVPKISRDDAMSQAMVMHDNPHLRFMLVPQKKTHGNQDGCLIDSSGRSLGFSTFYIPFGYLRLPGKTTILIGTLSIHESLSICSKTRGYINHT